MYSEIKCKVCRNTLFGIQLKQAFLNAHSESITSLPSDCESVNNANHIFIDTNNDNIPLWVMQAIETAEWSKGKLNCPHCDARIGGFDFVSGSKCQCSRCLLQPVRIIKSKVDPIGSNIP